MVYDGNGNVTDFVIDSVSDSQNFISLDRGPLSYVQSVINNLKAYIKKNGDLTVDDVYITAIRHGKIDKSYGAVEDKRVENPNYTFKSGTPTSSSAPASSSAVSNAAPDSSETASSAATPSK